MPEDLYNDGPAAGGGTPPEEGDSGGASKSAILPKTAFPDAKPGDNITVKVVRVNEQDIEVEPQGEGSKEEEQPPEEPQAPEEPQEGGGPMRSMLED